MRRHLFNISSCSNMLRYAATRRELAGIIARVYTQGQRAIVDYARENRPPQEARIITETSKLLIDAIPGDSMFALKYTSFGSWLDPNGAHAAIDEIANHGKQRGVKILIDAEDILYQDRCFELMRRYNTRRDAHVFSTYQMYRERAMKELKTDIERATFRLGAKLVRGAYVGRQCGLFDTKKEVDRAYNEAVDVTLSARNVQTILATHNEESLVRAKKYERNSYEIAQLMGFATPQADLVYVPTGSLRELAPYLLRRLIERFKWTP